MSFIFRFQFVKWQKCHVNCKFLSNIFSSLAKATDHKPCESGDITCLSSVIWLCALRPLNHPAKFGGHRPCGWGNMTFLNCHVTTGLKCHVTLFVRPLHLSHHPAKFGVHRPYGSGDNSVCNISTNSNSNPNSSSNAEVCK